MKADNITILKQVLEFGIDEYDMTAVRPWEAIDAVINTLLDQEKRIKRLEEIQQVGILSKQEKT